MAVIDIFTGLLGAGKTTLIARYGKYLTAEGKTYAIIENEFGSAGVDAALLGSFGAKVKELSGGCLCCTMKAGFSQLLCELAPQVDHIIVEPSGVFTLGDFFAVANTAAVRSVNSIGAVVTVIDATILPTLEGEDKALFMAQLQGTGCIVLNRGTAAHICELQMQTHVPILTDNGIDGAFDFAALQTAGGENAVCADINHALIYQSTSLFPKCTFTADEIYTYIEKTMNGSCGDILRIKGQLMSKEGGTLFVNCTKSGVQVTFTKEQIAPMLNIIGRRLDRRALKIIFEK